MFGLTGNKERRTNDQSLWLQVEPRVVEAFTGRGPLLRHHLQHGQKEVSEVAGIFVCPAVLLHQHVKQGPRLELSDMPQLTCTEARESMSVMASEDVRN